MTTEAKNQTTEKTDETLNADESKTLKSCEASIRNGLKAYQNVGRALTVIAQGRLYRATHSTMAKYAREKWDMTTARVAQLQHAYRVHELLSGAGLSPLPATESQCRPLARVPQNEDMDSTTIAIWQAVIDAKQAITAKLVDEKVDAALGIEREKAGAGGSAGANAGTGAGEGASDGHSASAEQRAEIRELKRKIAYLESALAAEKAAHRRAAESNGIPTSTLAKSLFKAGYRALAKTMHPDHGGTPEGMKELNSLKETLLGK